MTDNNPEVNTETPVRPRKTVEQLKRERAERAERIRRKKAKRRKQIIAIVAICIAMFVVVGCLGYGVFLYFRKLDQEERDKLAATNTEKVTVDNGVTEDESFLTETDITEAEGVSVETGMFYDTSVYQLVEPKDDSYFAEVCFIGDSRTKGMLEFSDLKAYHGFYEVGYTAKSACNNPIFTVPGRSGTYNVLDAIELCNDNVFYIAFGVNDMSNESTESLVLNMRRIIDKIEATHPEAVIYIENILPVSDHFSANNVRFSNDRIEVFNSSLYMMCKEDSNLVYLDVASTVKNGIGSAEKEYISDGLHYTRKGYAVIREYIKNNVVERITY